MKKAKMVTSNDLDNKNETAPFLAQQKPVRLSPSWEAQNIPSDQLNFKELAMAQDDIRDKWKLVFFIFALHGLGTLMPWNMFITAKSYFVDFKLSNNITGNATEPSIYASNFLQFVGFASQIPNLAFNWINIFVNLGGDLTKRVVYSILLEIILFIMTVVLAMVDSTNWPGVFFWLTMLTVVLLNMANGIYQNTIYGMVAILPIKYTGAVVLGSNMSGLFASILSIFSSYMFTSKRTAAIYYFIMAIVTLLVCFDTYFALPLNKFYRTHALSRKNNARRKSEEKLKVPYWQVFKQASPQLLNVFLVFFVTLAVFPAVHSDIKAVNENFFIGEDLFVLITCFLTFNLFAMLGSLLTSFVQWPGPKHLIIPCALRLIFIPLFMCCNYLPKNVNRTLPVLITNEWIYWTIAVIMSFSSGYLSALGMMYAPQTVDPKNQITAGMFAAAMLITGIFSGIMFSFLVPIIIGL